MSRLRTRDLDERLRSILRNGSGFAGTHLDDHFEQLAAYAANCGVEIEGEVLGDLLIFVAHVTKPETKAERLALLRSMPQAAE